MERCIDLTHTINASMPVYPGTEPPILAQANTIDVDGFAEKKLTMYSHTGTHMDAPAHMIAGGKTLDSYPVSQFSGEAFKLDATVIPSAKITLEQLLLVSEQIKKADYLVLHTGWSQFWGSEQYFANFPTLTAKAAEWVSQQGLKGIALDAISIDPVGDDYSNHLYILGSGMVIVENLTNLHLVPDHFSFYCLPLKLENSDGSPIRALGIIK